MLREALVGADVFLGVSTAGVLGASMVRSMAGNPLVMALNPDPEISYDEAKAARPRRDRRNRRTDYPNQVNNVLGFPYIFRGALDVRAHKINETMKLAAARLAELAREEVPAELAAAFGVDRLEFGPDYTVQAADPPAQPRRPASPRGRQIGRRNAVPTSNKKTKSSFRRTSRLCFLIPTRP